MRASNVIFPPMPHHKSSYALETACHISEVKRIYFLRVSHAHCAHRPGTVNTASSSVIEQISLVRHPETIMHLESCLLSQLDLTDLEHEGEIHLRALEFFLHP